jgi:hypothetical protein
MLFATPRVLVLMTVAGLSGGGDRSDIQASSAQLRQRRDG